MKYNVWVCWGLFLLLSQSLLAQKAETSFYIEPEAMIGMAVPHLSDFPKLNPNVGVHLSLGLWATEATEGWRSFYNHPQYGLEMAWHSMGDADLLGYQYSLMPFLTFNTHANWQKGIQIRLAGGANYFTTHYDAIHNPENEFIGSPFTWAFQATFQKSWAVGKYSRLKAGINLMHASNGHTTIPNYGLNIMQATVGWQFFPKGIPTIPTEKKSYKGRPKSYLLILRQGLGYHELGGAATPKGGDKFLVATTTAILGMEWRDFVRFKAGLSYRYYDSYSNYIQENDLAPYNDNRNWSSSNIILLGGVELLWGHFAGDVEVGFNLYKPFYQTHFEVFENTSESDRISKSWIATRAGAQIYALNNDRHPKHNVFLGAYINANFGQADFTEFTLGYVYRIR